MTETSHTRSRRTSLYGLLLQIVVFGGVLALSLVSRSSATFTLAFYMAGGIPIWFVSLLVFRQRELAGLEALDLDELRREKQASGGGTAMFDEEGSGALSFRVAEARLRWMQRWLIPAFGLLHALYLAGMGLYLWLTLEAIRSGAWARLENLPITMIVLAIVMFVLFLFSRYASGMGRVTEWQLLRGCGSYMLGNALGALALIICLGIYLYAGVATAERALAYVVCAMMLVLAVEALFTFILDIYRPRLLEAEPRPCYDSRLLALIAEPGGIASTIAEAMNYQFGFEVSQTWFYQLLQRTFIPLLGAGLVILWLLTCIVVVQPAETAIIERFGAQLNADEPCQSGFYWKLPWPIDVARKYNTGRLHQIIVGFKQFDAEPDEEKTKSVALWTDEVHMGQPHFDFIIPVPPAKQQQPEPVAEASPEEQTGPRKAEKALPVNMVRMDVAVQYKIRADRLAAFTQHLSNPHDALRDLAWKEVVRYNASWDILSLLGEQYGRVGPELKRRISRRVDELDLGLEVVYVGVQNIHPNPPVSKAFRTVVTAEQEKIAAIREARVKENQVLSAVAGDLDTAWELDQAISHINPNEVLLQQTELILRQADADVVAALQERLAALQPEFTGLVRARWRVELAQQERNKIEQEFRLGLGRDVEDKARAAEADLAEAERALEQAFAPIGASAAARLDQAGVSALRDHAQARFALEFWNAQLERPLRNLQGEAAAIIAYAHAKRWAYEMNAARELTLLRGERGAYRAAPRIYKIRKYLEVLTEGLKNSRKFFLAFDPAGREVRVSFIAEEQARPELADIQPRRETNP